MFQFVMQKMLVFLKYDHHDLVNLALGLVVDAAEILPSLVMQPFCKVFLPVVVDLIAGRKEPDVLQTGCYLAGLLVMAGEKPCIRSALHAARRCSLSWI